MSLFAKNDSSDTQKETLSMNTTLLNIKNFICLLMLFFAANMLLPGSMAFAAQATKQITPKTVHTLQKEPVSKKPAKKISLKIKQFITVVENVNNLESVSKAFQKAKFNSNELKTLEKELKNKNLIQKLDNLKKSVTPIQSKLSFKRINPKALLLKKQRALNLKNRQRARKPLAGKAGSRQKSEKKLSSSIRTSKPYVTARRVQGAQLASKTDTMMHPGIDLSHLPMITREVEIPINRNSIIHGRNFGDRQGVVLLKLDSPAWGIEEGLILPVTSWEENLIRFSVPNDRSLVESVGWESKSARIWLKMAGKDVYQATAQAFVYPDWEIYRMRIDRISPDIISPGTLITVQGENLGLGMRNRREAAIVRISKNGESISTELKSFTNNQVVVQVDEDTQGFTSGQAEITIHTRLSDHVWAMEGWHHTTITFQAAQEVKMVKNSDSVHCSPKFPPFLCLAGKTHRKTLHDWELKNGWVVDDTVLEAGHRGASGGAYYITQPENGSTRAKSRIEVWCNAFSSASYTEYLYIRGPKGVEF